MFKLLQSYINIGNSGYIAKEEPREALALGAFLKGHPGYPDII